MATPDNPNVPFSMQERWYAMRVFNNRIFRIKEEAEQRGARTYMALRPAKAAKAAAGQTVASQPTASSQPAAVNPAAKSARPVQLAPSLLFVRCTEDALKAFKQDHFSDLMVYRRADSTEPAPIDEREMQMFILVTSATDGYGVDLFDPGTYDFRAGDRVRVTEGPFKGAEGIVKRIKKDRKLLVQVSGVVVVAVSQIPGAFLERIPD